MTTPNDPGGPDPGGPDPGGPEAGHPEAGGSEAGSPEHGAPAPGPDTADTPPVRAPLASDQAAAPAGETTAQQDTRRTRAGRRVGAVMRHRATAVVAAALAGLVIGGGVVAAVDGPGHPGPAGQHGVMHHPGHRPGWFDDQNP